MVWPISPYSGLESRNHRSTTDILSYASGVCVSWVVYNASASEIRLITTYLRDDELKSELQSLNMNDASIFPSHFNNDASNLRAMFLEDFVSNQAQKTSIFWSFLLEIRWGIKCKYRPFLDHIL